jgi:hypothetical protein
MAGKKNAHVALNNNHSLTTLKKIHVWNLIMFVISSNTGYVAFIQHYLSFTQLLHTH